MTECGAIAGASKVWTNPARVSAQAAIERGYARTTSVGGLGVSRASRRQAPYMTSNSGAGMGLPK
jgi:hypothetical protein